MEQLSLENGKYLIVNGLGKGGGIHALRYGEVWRDLTGDNLVLAMFHRIEELQNEVDQYKKTQEETNE